MGKRSRKWDVTIANVSLLFLLANQTFGQNPLSSNGALGALNVPSGTVVFDTGDGTYTVNGVPQSGTARLVTIPADSGPLMHEAADIYVFDFTQINLASGVIVSVEGESGLVLLASGTANLAATFEMSGTSGEDGGFDGGGGGGGAGGGVLSVFVDGNLGFSGTIDVRGGDAGASFAGSAGVAGGVGGIGSGGGGAGGDGGSGKLSVASKFDPSPQSPGGKGGNGGNGAFVGVFSTGFYLDGGGGGGGGGYSGGVGGGGSTGGSAGNPGAGGACWAAAVGGKGGSGFIIAGNNGGAAGGGNGGSGLLAPGGGGGGGNAPGGTPGGAGGAGGIGEGGGGGGGGGDKCVAEGQGGGKPDNGGGGGGGGGGDGNPGSQILAVVKSGGGGGGGQVFLGTATGVLTYSGNGMGFGGAGTSGNGGNGSLKLIALGIGNLSIQPGALWNGVLPLTPGSGSTFLPNLSLSDYLPVGGGGGGGAGGSGIEEEATSFMTACCLPVDQCIVEDVELCIIDNGVVLGPGTACTQYTCNGSPIPTLSEWTAIGMTLLLLAAGTIVFFRTRLPQARAD